MDFDYSFEFVNHLFALPGKDTTWNCSLIQVIWCWPTCRLALNYHAWCFSYQWMLLNPQWIASLNRKSCHLGSDFYCLLLPFLFCMCECILLLVIHMYFLWHFPASGCLPTLVTIPVWIGLYRALSNVANEVAKLKNLFCRCQFFIIEH